MRLKGIQSKLFLAFSALIIIVSLFYTRLSYLSVLVTEDIFASFLLENEAELLTQRQRIANAPLLTSYPFFRIVTDSDTFKQCSKRELIHNTAVYELQCDENKHYVYNLPVDAKPAMWLLLDTSEQLPLSRFASILSVFFFSISLGAILLAVLATWLLASRLSKPIQALTQAVLQQKRQADVIVTGTEREDEIGQLARAFSVTYDELQQALKREQNFTRDVSHELRTPITLIKNTLTLHDKAPPDSGAIQLIQQATNELQQTVNILLALARKENLVFSQHRLLPMIEKAVLSIHQLHTEDCFDVDVDVASNIAVYGNPHLIGLLCQNLINNGFYHGGGTSMSIRFDGTLLVFENPIADNSENTYYQGLGHGQYLVTRIAAVMGWNIDIEQKADCYRVTLQPKL